jgi:hypothetical protein
MGDAFMRGIGSLRRLERAVDEQAPFRLFCGAQVESELASITCGLSNRFRLAYAKNVVEDLTAGSAGDSGVSFGANRNVPKLGLAAGNANRRKSGHVGRPPTAEASSGLN